MHIKKLFLEMIFILAIVSCVVITINNFEVHRNAQQNLLKIQAQYLGATYEIYRNEMIGDILIGNKNITQSLINEISNTRKVGVILQYNNQELHSNQYHHQKPFISYDLNLGNKEFSELKLFPLDAAKKFYFFRDFFILFFLEILILSFGFIFLLKRFNEKLFLPLKEIFINVSNNTIPRLSLNKNTIIELQELADTLKLMHNDIQKKAKFEAEAQAARQLAHDIRSPLASLNLLLSFISELPEKPRVLMRSSINRITDIANSLQNKGEEAHLASSELCNKTKIAMISSAVESVVTEKRFQLINNKKIYIDSYLENAYGLFSNLDSTELKRVLSNLINNSFESFDDAVHHISINIFCKEKLIVGGTGLGVFHAKKTIESAQGALSIISKEQSGTTVTITLPKAISPSWFVNQINLKNIFVIVILDDDDSIHRLWETKLSDYAHLITILHCRRQSELACYVQSRNSNDLINTLFLIDYELVGQAYNGLELIVSFKLNHQSILITSHHEDRYLLNRITQEKIKLIPKSIVQYAPVYPARLMQ